MFCLKQLFQLEIASRSVSLEGTWLKCDIQSIMSNVTPQKDSGHMISHIQNLYDR